jgi:hypothetical protein
MMQLRFAARHKGLTFNTKLDLKNHCLINPKIVFETPNPAFSAGALTFRRFCYYYIFV